MDEQLFGNVLNNAGASDLAVHSLTIPVASPVLVWRYSKNPAKAGFSKD